MTDDWDEGVGGREGREGFSRDDAVRANASGANGPGARMDACCG